MTDQPYSVSTTWEDGILRIVVKGRQGDQKFSEIAAVIFQHLGEKRPECALVDVRALVGRPSTFETYDGVRAYPPRRYVPRRQAVLDLPAHRDFFSFHEDTSANVGVPLKYFTDEAAALVWLREKD